MLCACATREIASPSGSYTTLSDDIDYASLQPRVDGDSAQRILAVANSWATRHCFLPSNLKVSVVVRNQTARSLTLYIYSPYENLIGPEAHLTLTYPGLRIAGAQTWHIDPKILCRRDR